MMNVSEAPICHMTEQSLRLLAIALAMPVILTYAAPQTETLLPAEILADITAIKTLLIQCLYNIITLWAIIKITIGFLQIDHSKIQKHHQSYNTQQEP